MKRLRVLARFFSDVPAARIDADLASLGLQGQPYADHMRALVVDDAQLMDLADLDTVQSVWPGPMELLPALETSRGMTGTDAVQGFSTSGATAAYGGLSGSGVKIGICDLGIHEGQVDFGGGKFYRTWAPQPGDWHGTHVASVAAGTGAGSSILNMPAFERRGHAPLARIGDYGRVILGNVITENTNAYGAGIYMSAECKPLIANNIIAHNNANDMEKGGGGIFCAWGSTPKIPWLCISRMSSPCRQTWPGSPDCLSRWVLTEKAFPSACS